ncbi:MAG TPA: amidohydrolase family protein, partial [Thermoanaerobaculia bacterium]|nr:amidohydrolase family protein [Thermoanaerobaculia bacterium]
GLAVAPGFINMLSWSTESLIVDGKSQSEVRQGVTTQIFGEGMSMGPLDDRLRERLETQQVDFRYDMEWTTLAEYLTFLEQRGVAQNVASFVGATTIRAHVIGFDDREPTPEELDEMRELVRAEMEAGALGIGSSLIYAPANYASTEELIELSKVAAEYGGMYISHMRSEGGALLEAIDELIRISREAGLPAEIYHLKAGGRDNWPRMDEAIARVEAARAEGLRITADMYTYPAGATSLAACIPPWAHAGGNEAMLERLADPQTRRRIAKEIRRPGEGWENLYHLAGTPDGILLVGFGPESMRSMIGQTLGEIAAGRGKDPVDTLFELVEESQGAVDAVYFMMSEDNLAKQIRLPWMSFGSDAASMAPEGVFLKSSTHPRAYGNFARLLGKYVREEQMISLEEAIRRLTSLPADNLRLDRRGKLEPGFFADMVVFDPATIADRATFEDPHQYAVGVQHVFVNGVQVLRDGEHTGALPGRALRKLPKDDAPR